MKKRAAPPLRPESNYLRAFAEVMKRIERALKPKGDKPVVICVAGGAAVHFYTGSRVSKDIDATIMARFLPPDDLEVSYQDADGHARLLYFDTQYNDTFALLHENAYEDAVSIQIPGLNAQNLDVRLLTPMDLAVSKLSRFETHDQDDIRALARLGLLDPAALRRRAEEALPNHVGDTRRVRNSIALAEKLVIKNLPD